MARVGPPSGGHCNYRPPSGGRTTTHQGGRTGMADLRTARRTAEQLARDALGGTLLGAAGELGVALARRAEAAGTIAAAAERAREIVRAAEAEAAAVVDRARQEATEADTGCAAWAIPGRPHPAGGRPPRHRPSRYPAPSTPPPRRAPSSPAARRTCGGEG